MRQKTIGKENKLQALMRRWLKTRRRQYDYLRRQKEGKLLGFIDSTLRQ
jgi:hypothetical protein